MLACLVVPLYGAPALAQGSCDPDETKIGEDRLHIYCMSTSILNTCRSRGGNVDRCVNAGCVKTAGLTLEARRKSCVEENTICLGELGASSAVITAIVSCAAGLALTENPAIACYAGSLIGGGQYDYAVATCRTKFGRCVEPALVEHKNFVALCNKVRF
jgi:hypothetical protein